MTAAPSANGQAAAPAATQVGALVQAMNQPSAGPSGDGGNKAPLDGVFDRGYKFSSSLEYTTGWTDYLATNDEPLGGITLGINSRKYAYQREIDASVRYSQGSSEPSIKALKVDIRSWRPSLLRTGTWEPSGRGIYRKTGMERDNPTESITLDDARKVSVKGNKFIVDLLSGRFLQRVILDTETGVIHFIEASDGSFGRWLNNLFKIGVSARGTISRG